MKHISTLTAAIALASALHAQVSVVILDPPQLAGPYENLYAEADNGWTIMPDMTQTANSVTGELALAQDATAADSLCCEAIANAGAIAGKIAVFYRGTCDYSEKAYNCQQAGAIGCIIINNVAAFPTGIGGGSQGTLVDIPVFLISQADGAAIRQELDLGTTVNGYLGSVLGYFPNDVGLTPADLLLPQMAAMPALLAQSASEYSAVLGGWVRNTGTSLQDNVTLNVTVTQNSNTLYDETSDPVSVAVGDSVFIELPAFSQPGYDGQYAITYTVATAAGDDYTYNNERSTTLTFGSSFCYAPIDLATGQPESNNAVMPSPRDGIFSYCMHIRDANASRVAVTGMHVLAAINDATLDQQLITITANEWLDEFTGISDYAFDALLEVSLVDHIIESDSDRWEGFIAFPQPIQLLDNQRYLFCVTTPDPNVFLGSDDVDYNAIENFNDQPTCPILNGTQWRRGLIGTTNAAVLGTIDANTIGMAEQDRAEAPAFPNPAKDEVRIPLRCFQGLAEVRVLDATGSLVSTRRAMAQGGQLIVPTRDIAPGAYTFAVIPVEGPQRSFRVVIAR